MRESLFQFWFLQQRFQQQVAALPVLVVGDAAAETLEWESFAARVN